MGKNRRTTKRYSIVVTSTVRFGVIVLSFFVMVILNLLSTSRCSQLVSEKGRLEKEIARLEAACQRESSRWEEMKTPEKIEAALVRHGLRMSLPRFDQTIRINRDGTIPAGQIAIVRAKQRGTMARSAAYRRPTGRR